MIYAPPCSLTTTPTGTLPIVQIAARYGGIGASGGGLIDGWADRPPLNQYDRRNYRSDHSLLTWRDADCSAAALD